MAQQIKVSPDGESVAIRRPDTDEDAWNAWAVMNCREGGGMAKSTVVADWTDVLNPAG